MVMVDKALEVKTEEIAYIVKFFSKRYGLMETRTYGDMLTAKRQASKAMANDMNYDHCEIWFDGQLLHTDSYGYDMRWAITRLRAFRNCCRDVISGWEIEAEAFRLIVDKGYIVPAENHLEHEAGYWYITPRFRKVGNYLVKRRWW